VGTLLYVDQPVPAVLVICHDRWTRHVAESALGTSPYRVRTASNGITGLRLVEREHPDLILLGMHLPELSGVQLLDELDKQTGPRPSVVVLADASVDAEASIDRHLVDGVLRMPFTERQLLDRVAWVFGKRSAAWREDKDVRYATLGPGGRRLVRRYTHTFTRRSPPETRRERSTHNVQ
jgi:DNA-binding response OmpR family regulator